MAFSPLPAPRNPSSIGFRAFLETLSHDAEYAKILGNVGIDAIYQGPDGLAQAIRSDIMLYKAALEAAGLMRRNGAK